MRSYDDILKDLIEFCSTIRKLTVSPDIDIHRATFEKLKKEIMELYPGDPLFNKKIYFTSSFDYKYPDMQEACNDLLFLLADNK